MDLFKKKKNIIVLVNNRDLHFFAFDLHDKRQILSSFPLDRFLTDNPASGLIPESANTLLILPDYWFGNVGYSFQSKNNSLVEAFIERKLLSQHPDLPEIKYFFEYLFYQTDKERHGLYVYFMQSPESFQLHEKLSQLNLNPSRITCPAFLWEKKLNNIIPKFCESGDSLVHLLQSECFLYFFSRGRFLFSRLIPLEQNESSEKFEVLTYEIKQSLHLFSQKAKNEIDRIHLLSSGKGDAEKLSGMLEKDVTRLDFPTSCDPQHQSIVEHLGPVAPFNAGDLSRSNTFISLAHKMLRKTQEWRPVQTAGMIIGLLILLLMIGEGLFLHKWLITRPFQSSTPGLAEEKERESILKAHHKAIDLLLKETAHPPAKDTIVKIAESLPDNIRISELTLDMDKIPGVEIKGAVMADGPDRLKISLSILLANLRGHFQGSRSLSMQDIDFMLERSMDKGLQKYLIRFRFDLP